MNKLLFVLLICLPCMSARANDTAGYVLPTGGVVFQKQDGIKMKNEALYIRPGQIEVNYLFENTTDKDITTQVFFPLPPIAAVADYYGYTWEALHQFHFKLWVNGKPKKYQTVFNLKQGERAVPAAANSLWKYPEEGLNEPLFHERVSAMKEKDRQLLIDGKFLHWGGVFLPNSETGDYEEAEGWTITDWEDKMWTKEISYSWLQTFPAGKTVHIRHTYTPSAKTINTGMPFSACINPNTWDYQDFVRIPTPPGTDRLWDKLQAQHYVEYILTTASNWQGFIDDFNLLVESPLKSVGCFEGQPFYGEKYFAVSRRYFYPERNLSVDFLEKGSIPSSYTPTSNPVLFRVDGPANVRKEPNGKIVGEMKDGTYAWVWPGEKQGNWYPVLQNNLQGYTHKQNLIKVFEPGVK